MHTEVMITIGLMVVGWDAGGALGSGERLAGGGRAADRVQDAVEPLAQSRRGRLV
jgi:hypothetical protein